MMSSVRFILRDIGINKLRNVWTRSVNLSSVVRRYRRDKYVRDVIQCFRQAFFRPRRTLLLSATAAYKAKGGDDDKPPSCEKNITDEELEALVTELEAIEELSRETLYCASCKKRLVIDRKQSGVTYCLCKDSRSPDTSKDGWEPYMEAEDVIIWRKEYKPGQGLYAYKVYGRYKEVTASHFAAVQVDSGYRQVWDSAVAALAVVERSPSVPDQAIIHWEVLWPRLFANRDYVYIRRHKEYNVNTKSTHNLFEDAASPAPAQPEERESVHSNAKRKANESYSGVEESGTKRNKVYIIVSKSCEHPDVPETKHAIRVSEYWSHMVVRTIDGADNAGMEFVLTYYDEPAVGGLPSGVATWATGRAAPNYLGKMRAAARQYSVYRQTDAQDIPEFMPSQPDKVSYDAKLTTVSEEQMESSKQGPDLENGGVRSKDQSTQTEDSVPDNAKEDKAVGTSDDGDAESNKDSSKSDGERDDSSPDDEETSSRWWRYLHPFYYFV